MRFETNDDELTITFRLENEPEEVDLTANRLGEDILDHAQFGFTGAAQQEQEPSGQAWTPLKDSTIAQKGDARIGYRTGKMIGDLYGGDRNVSPRSCTWSYPRGDTWPRAHGFHNGNPRTNSPPRPLIGWTAEAQDQARQLVAWAIADATTDAKP